MDEDKSLSHDEDKKVNKLTKDNKNNEINYSFELIKLVVAAVLAFLGGALLKVIDAKKILNFAISFIPAAVVVAYLFHRWFFLKKFITPIDRKYMIKDAIFPGGLFFVSLVFLIVVHCYSDVFKFEVTPEITVTNTGVSVAEQDGTATLETTPDPEPTLIDTFTPTLANTPTPTSTTPSPTITPTPQPTQTSTSHPTVGCMSNDWIVYPTNYKSYKDFHEASGCYIFEDIDFFGEESKFKIVKDLVDDSNIWGIQRHIESTKYTISFQIKLNYVNVKDLEETEANEIFIGFVDPDGQFSYENLIILKRFGTHWYYEFVFNGETLFNNDNEEEEVNIADGDEVFIELSVSDEEVVTPTNESNLTLEESEAKLNVEFSIKFGQYTESGMYEIGVNDNFFIAYMFTGPSKINVEFWDFTISK